MTPTRGASLQWKLTVGLVVIVMMPLVVSYFLIDQIGKVAANFAAGEADTHVVVMDKALDVYRDQNLFARAKEIAPRWEKAAHALKQAPHVVDIRNIGILAAIDLAPREGAAGARGAEAAARCYEDGVLIRGSSDTLVLSPPLIVT